MDKVMDVLQEKKFVISSSFIRNIEKEMSLKDFLILVYLENSSEHHLNCKEIENLFGLKESEILNSFNNLLSSNLVKMDSNKDQDGLIHECITLDPFYQEIVNRMQEKSKSDTKIYDAFEREFGHTLSRTDYELINGWLETGISEDLILGALKEAVFNNTKSFRYIDKIIYEWTKEGYKSMEEVNQGRRSASLKAQEEYFDYDWLNDEEE